MATPVFFSTRQPRVARAHRCVCIFCISLSNRMRSYTPICNVLQSQRKQVRMWLLQVPKPYIRCAISSVHPLCIGAVARQHSVKMVTHCTDSVDHHVEHPGTWDSGLHLGICFHLVCYRRETEGRKIVEIMALGCGLHFSTSHSITNSLTRLHAVFHS